MDDQISYLDNAASSDAGQEYKRRLLRALDVHRGDIVLDVGCGPATDLADLAAAVGPDGSVIGLDRDPAMAAEARHRTRRHHRVRVHVGDAHALPLPDTSVDRVRADRVLQHLADPEQAVAEFHRVVRAGGLVALAEPDWDTLVIDDQDLATSRTYARFVAERVVRNGAIGRQLIRLLVGAGFAVHHANATMVVFRDFNAAEPVLRLHSVCERAWRAGALTEQAGGAWLSRMSGGPFLAGFVLFTAVGRAPVPGSPTPLTSSSG